MGTTTTALTTTDSKLIKTLLRDDVVVDVLIPEEINSDQFWNSLSAVSRAMAHTENTQGRLMPVLGRLLAVARKHPDLFLDQGYGDYEDFVNRGVSQTFHVSRATCYEAKRMAERWGEFTVALFGEVGRVKMNLLTKAVAKGDEKKGYAKKLIEKASELTVEDFRNHLDKLPPAGGQVERSTTIPEKIVILTNKKRAKLIRQFFESPEVIAYCGSDKWDVILEHLIAEAQTEWVARVREVQEGTEVAQ
jgi:hypothetical protein